MFKPDEDEEALYPPKLGAFSGNPMPSILDGRYPVLMHMAQSLTLAKMRVARGEGGQEERGTIASCGKTFELYGLDPRDFGFEAVPELDLIVPNGTVWGRA
jgi:hypothetical protein